MIIVYFQELAALDVIHKSVWVKVSHSLGFRAWFDFIPVQFIMVI